MLKDFYNDIYDDLHILGLVRRADYPAVILVSRLCVYVMAHYPILAHDKKKTVIISYWLHRGPFMYYIRLHFYDILVSRLCVYDMAHYFFIYLTIT